jgi:hypothetical protein
MPYSKVKTVNCNVTNNFFHDKNTSFDHGIIINKMYHLTFVGTKDQDFTVVYLLSLKNPKF